MIKGLGLLETKDYVSKFDIEEPKTIFKIGVLDSDIYDMIDSGQSNTATAMTTAVRYGLKGFEGFVDSTGKPIRFVTVPHIVGQTTYQIVADSIMKILAPQVKYELAVEILKMSKLNEEEIKN